MAFYENAGELKRLVYKDLTRIIERLATLPPYNDSLELNLETEATVENVIDKLNALQNIYNTLCELAGVSLSSYPLSVQSMESGSLWLKIFGESKILSAFRKIIEDVIGYLYRRHTSEGQVAAIPNQLEVLKATLELSKKMEEAGIDTKEIQDGMRDATISVISNFHRLVSNTSMITIDCPKTKLLKQDPDIT